MENNRTLQDIVENIDHKKSKKELSPLNSFLIHLSQDKTKNDVDMKNTPERSEKVGGQSR